MLRSHRIAYDSLRYGYRFKDYTLLERVGEGGEADIWSAWDLVNKRVVAIRVIPKAIIDSEADNQIPSDVQRQVELLSKIEHPNVLPHYEFGSEELFHYIVMRYCSSGSLADRIIAGPISLEEVLRYTAQIISALDYLHNRKIVHRDLNPSNLLLDGQGRVYLADFGLAKLFVQDTLPMHTGRGTEIYAPYEQFARFEVVPQSDIYSLGITIFEMLTGRLPWGDSGIIASKPGEQSLSLPDLKAYNANLPADLTDVLRVMTAYYWDQRPSSAKAAYEMLLEAAGFENREDFLVYESLPLLEEDTLIRQDALYLLDRFQSIFDPATEKFPVRLTHFVVIDSGCQLDKPHPIEMQDGMGRFMLRGAITHNYHVEEWWQRLTNRQDRTLVCLNIISNENESIVGRALTQLLSDEEAVELPGSLGPVVLERLVEIASSSMSWSLRSKAMETIKRLIPKAEKWQPIGISTQSDYKLAGVALTESSISGEAAQLVGWIGSLTAVQVLVDAYSDDESERILEVFREVKASAGTLPNIVPAGVRFRVNARIAQGLWLRDQEGFSIPHLLIGLFAGLLVTIMMIWGIFSQIDARMRDSLFEPYPVSNVVTIVQVSDDDLDYYGRWDSWPRSLHAELIDQLSKAGARAILLDFVFNAETPDDAVLADAMRRAGTVIQPILGVEDANLEKIGEPRYPDLVPPNPDLIEASAALGHTNIVHDPDGYVRQMPTIIRVDEDQYMSLPMAAIQVFLNIKDTQPWKFVDGSLGFAGRQIPIDRNGIMIINYAGQPARPENHTYQMVNYRSVVEGLVQEELIKDKIVLVGITATGGKDFFLTPVSNGRPMAGIEILANVVETIWSSRFVSRPAPGLRVLILLFLGALIGVVARHVWSGLVITGLVAVSYFLLTSWLFDFSGVMLDLFYPFAVMLLSFVMAMIYRLTK